MAEFQIIIRVDENPPTNPISLEAKDIDSALTKVIQAMAGMEQELYVQPKKNTRIITSKRGNETWVRTIKSL